MHTDLGMFFGLFFGIANGFSTFCSAKKTFDLIHLSGAYAAKELWRISARTVSISPYLSKENVDLNLEHYWILRWILPTNVWISPGTIWFNMVSVSTNIWISHMDFTVSPLWLTLRAEIGVPMASKNRWDHLRCAGKYLHLYGDIFRPAKDFPPCCRASKVGYNMIMLYHVISTSPNKSLFVYVFCCSNQHVDLGFAGLLTSVNDRHSGGN